MTTKRTWLVFDVNNLAWRAQYTTGHLSHEDKPTGVIYGFLRELRMSMQRWATSDCVFCFDHGKSLRSQKYPWYKESRRTKKRTEEEELAREGCLEQIDLIRNSLVDRIGLGNVVYKSGYEADDLIASVVYGLPNHHRAVIVSGDQDLYQCIGKRCVVYHPAQKKIMDWKKFCEEYQIDPSLWSHVKAIAGCKSDNIPGIGGQVGEKTACVYLAKKIDILSKVKHQRIVDAKSVIDRNLQLTLLPWPGTPRPKLEEGLGVDAQAWDGVMQEFQFVTMSEANLSRGFLNKGNGG